MMIDKNKLIGEMIVFMGRKKKGLEVGNTYKSLKEIFDILKLEYSKSADSRKAKLKKIESEYKLERKGNSYTVLERYDTPKEILDKRKETKGNFTGKGKYETLMDSLILDWLSEYKNNNEIEVNIAFTQLFLKDDELINIPILSPIYKELLNNGYENFARKFNIGKKDLVNIYAEKLYLITSKCLETALNRLQRQEIITWSKEINIKYYSGDDVLADKDLKLEIKQAEQEIYEETKLTPFHRRNPKVNKAFKNKVYRKLGKHQISSYWNVYSIEILDDEKLIEIDNYKEVIKDLTIRFHESIFISLLKKKYKFKKEMALGKPRIEERLAFVQQEEDMIKLSGLLLINYTKDYNDFLNELMSKEEIEEEEIEMDFSLLF